MWQYAELEINALLWTFLILLTTILLKRMVGLCVLWMRAWKLPGPPAQFCWWNFGNLTRFNGPENFTDFFGALHKQYGPIVRVWLGPTVLLVSVKNRNVLKELLIRARDRIPPSRKAFQLAFGRNSLFFSSFSQAQKRRLVLSREFNGRLLETVYFTSLKVVDDLSNWAEMGKEGWEADCKLFCQHVSFSVLGMSIFGKRFPSWAEAAEFEDVLGRVSAEACMWATYRIAPMWKQGFRKYRRACLRLRELTGELIALGRDGASRRLSNKSPLLDHAGVSYLDAIIEGNDMTRSDCAVGFVEDLVAGIVSSQECSKVSGHLMSLICHACFATAGILGGVLTRLAQHREVQDKVYGEIKVVCGTRVPPTLEQLKRLHFLFATIHESARLLPTSQILQRCCLDQDLTLEQGLVIPTGAILAVPIQLLQMDKHVWGHDVDLFNPYRFLRSHNSGEDESKLQVASTASGDETGLQGTWEVISSIDSQEREDDGQLIFQNPEGNPSFLAFGAGSRSCLGKEFCVRNMATILASLVQRFEIKFGPDCDTIFQPKIDNFVQQLSPSPKLIFVPRSYEGLECSSNMPL